MARSNKVYFLFCARIYLNLLGHGYSISDIIVEFGGMKLNVERLEKSFTQFKKSMNEKLARMDIRLNEGKSRIP